MPRVSVVVIAYNEFKSVMQQQVVMDQLLPIPRAAVTDPAEGRVDVDYLYEPAPQEIFNQLLPRYIEAQIYRALLESNAAFFAAQMTAMDTATKNSADMISSLTLFLLSCQRSIARPMPGKQSLLSNLLKLPATFMRRSRAP